jgi:hypothetical protein
VDTELPAELREFAENLRGDAEALLVGGSLATGDYHPGISDMDLVAITDDAGDIRQRHRKGSKLHCVYVPRARLADVHQGHPTWTTGVLVQRPLTRIARAELHRHGFSVFGPEPRELIPDQDLALAVREELERYWVRMLDVPWFWLEDAYVDLSLVTMARAEAAVKEDRLITKAEAISRIRAPEWLRDEVGKRRAGYRPRSRPTRRARIARDVTAGLIRELLG